MIVHIANKQNIILIPNVQIKPINIHKYINTKKPFKDGHTHVRDLYVGRVIIDNVRKEILPKSRSEKTIISHIRVSSSKEYTKRLEEYLEKVRKENTL